MSAPYVIAQTETLTLWSDGRLYISDPLTHFVTAQDHYKESR